MLIIQKFFYKASIRKLLKLENQKLIFHLLLFAVLPLILSMIHQDYFFTQSHISHWLNPRNAYIVVIFYLVAKYLVEVGSSIHKKKLNKLLVLVLSSSFIIDFFYSFYKELNGMNHNHRWDGSANNPNIWAVQACFILFLLIISRPLFLSKKKFSLLYSILLAFPIIAIFMAASWNSFVSLGFAALPILLPLPLWAFCFIVLGVLAFSIFIVYGDLNIIRENLVIPKKIIPRIKIWQHLQEFFSSADFNLIFGAGYQKYIEWTQPLVKRGSDHLHNGYLHSFALNGLLGLYASFAYMFHLTQENFGKLFQSKNQSHKYYLALIVFILVNNCFDCSFFFYEIQIMFWLMLPLLESQFKN